jgi:hypothetical protein
MIKSLGNISAKALRRDNKNTGEKPVPVRLSPQQIPHKLAGK